MTDCFQLPGQLSDRYCGLIWLSGSKIIIFLIFTAPKHSGWRRWPVKNHPCETKTTSRLRGDGSDILQADYTSKTWKAKTQFFLLLKYDFKMPSSHIVSNTVAKSIPKCNISSFVGITLAFGAALVELGWSCIFYCFGAGVLQSR